jgi:hypothetical protein
LIVRLPLEHLQANHRRRLYLAAKHQRGHPGALHHPQRIGRIMRAKQFLHFIGDTLARKFGQHPLLFADCLKRNLIGWRRAKHRKEAKEPQDAQAILGNARGRIPNEGNALLRNIRFPIEIIVNVPRRIHAQCVDGEITPAGILAPILGEGHRCAPSIRRHIAS